MVRILADSSSDCMLSELQEKNIDLIPISVTFQGKEYRDGIDIDKNEFFKNLTESDDFPQTSQPSPQVFLDVFKDVKKNNDEIVCILLSSSLSGTYQSAMLAKTMANYDKIYIVDSLTASYPIKIMLDYACELRGKGFSAKDIASKIENLKSHVKIYAVLDTLKYLQKGGRLSKAAATIGNLANIKPTIAVTEDGNVGVLGKSIGKNKATNTLLEKIGALEIDTNFPIYTIYSYGVENLMKFEKKLEDLNYKITERLQIGTTIGTHIGPEAFGIVFVTKS